MKVGVLGQQLKLSVEDLQALLRDLVRHDVVDRDLQPLQTGPAEALNPFNREQVSIGNEACDHSAIANAANDAVQLRMEQRLASADSDDRGAQVRQLVHTAVHILQRHGLGKVIELVAVLASEIAAAHRNEVRQQRMIGSEQSAQHFPGTA